ncbi:glycoside hydrolase family 3 N-terminal domain-containing protein [Halapricum hydrolyticum]|uniref:beta-glucosidase n=1 Tax=Halapricum hydrolyticum TaxID=2979991 RepID=A0AAE3I9P9_9EURY|nr:glycoside hydrolase family 3 N-terminal domain-containing protein [Halapricum hydrolyticum]MCU4717069.1 glycoside hydrolase family 3 C-terminal domain-containing protein [Halapricum hydrolyticum]MCU4725996.1 glycoside hydrolase family 3 C-terminal domain-containing protein [Halapricum hydrolyticum]
MANVDEQPPYRNPSVSTDQRVDDLLDRMTLSEKVGQLVGTWAGELNSTKDLDDVEREIVEHGVGAVASFGWAGARDRRVDDVVETVNRLQEVALSETRLGIPLLFNVDAVHGHAYVTEGTAFPNGLGMAATWDEDMAEAGAAVTAREVRASGAHQNYSPTCDVARDPRWGRAFETFGESPYLCGKFAAAKVRGYQGDGIEEDTSVIATAKHFPAYSEPVRGEDASPVEISEYLQRNVFAPSFVDALEADVESVMPCYNAIGGEPAHGSRRLLTEYLRSDLGFEGTVVSDWHGVEMLHEDHQVTADHRGSVQLTREAGLDIASVDAINHAQHLQSLVEDGELAESVVDESVRRVLEQKFRLGLFEDPFVDSETAPEVVGNDEHRDQALEAARESMTLLSNDGALPLDADTDVLVAGPNADDPLHQLGGWSIPDTEGADIVTIREGIESLAAGDVTYERGSGIAEPDDIEAAAEAAADADVAVVAVGENWYIHEFGQNATSGIDNEQFPNRTQLELPRAQRDLLEAIHETGTPIVGVLVTGRPLAVNWLAEHAAGLLMAYYPGTMGGQAVAETLYGENDPSGRLPISIPRSTGNLPTRFNYLRHPMPIGGEEHLDSYDPLFAFGHGESYAEFEYGEVAVSETTLGPEESTTITVPVENTSDRPGTAVVQAYVSPDVSSRVRPVRELRGFDRLTLAGGESGTLTIELPAASLGLAQQDGSRVVEAGTYTIEIADQQATVTVETN